MSESEQYVNVCCPFCENGGKVVYIEYLPDQDLTFYRCKECGHYFHYHHDVLNSRLYHENNQESEEESDESEETEAQPDEKKEEPIRYYGMATITIHFENRAQWQKYRKYILKTDWDFDGGMMPYTAHLEERFSCMDDVEKITRQIVQLLQIGFDIYSCKWTLSKDGDKQKVEYLDMDGTFKTDVID